MEPTGPTDDATASRQWFSPVSSGASILADIDYDRDGKQFGSLCVIQPSGGIGWQPLLIPIVCIHNGAGPTLLLLGGTHGDELDGPVALLKLARELQPDEIRGRVIIVPALNYLAVDACERAAPVDGRDLNRSFPGRPDGSLAEMIAHYLDSVLLPLSDLVLDLHAGGLRHRFLRSIWLNEGAAPELWNRTLRAAEAFGAPYTAVSASLGGDMSESAARRDCVYMSTEAGGGATVDPAVVTLSEAGIRRVMAHLALTPADKAPRQAAPTRWLRVPDSRGQLLAEGHGLFEPVVNVGDEVVAGQLIGRLHRIERPEAPATELRAPISGLVYGLRWLAHVRHGALVATFAIAEKPPVFTGDEARTA